MIVSNSSPLIFLAKLNLFDNVKKLYKTVLIPQEVYDEVIGKGHDFKEALILQGLLDAGFLRVVDVQTTERSELKSLHLGERKAIALCLQQKMKNILIDDKEAIEYCRLLGIDAIRTTRLLLEMVKQKLFTVEEFDDALVQLSAEGYFLTIEVYQYLMEAARTYEKQ